MDKDELIKQQAAVIERLREALSYYKDAVCAGYSPGGGCYELEPDGFVAAEALTLQPCPEVLNKVRAEAIYSFTECLREQLEYFGATVKQMAEEFVAQHIEKGEV